MHHIEQDGFHALFVNDHPLIDARAPVEFSRGSFPRAVNLPLMTDEEREQVGLCYAEFGQDEAIALGERLVAGETKEARINRWIQHLEQSPQAAFFCFRGGLRSQIVQEWLQASGHNVPVILGGYKALRRYLLDALEASLTTLDLWVVAGRTGTAKTALLNHGADTGQFPCIDLEGLANHRGSAFGKRVDPQPSQIDFENSLSIALLKAVYHGNHSVAVEDESRLIGRCSLPVILQERLATARVVTVEASLETRVHHSWQNYILQNYQDHLHACANAEEAFLRFSSALRSSLTNIKKRLGDVRYDELAAILESSLASHASGQPEAHKSWIEVLLRDYYDPMYDYQLKSKERQSVFTGDYDAVYAFLAETVSPGA